MELLLGHMIILCLTCEEIINHFSQPLHSSASLPVSCGVYNFSTFSLTLLVLCYIIIPILVEVFFSWSQWFLCFPSLSFFVTSSPVCFSAIFSLREIPSGNLQLLFLFFETSSWETAFYFYPLLLLSRPAINKLSQYFLLYHSRSFRYLFPKWELLLFFFFSGPYPHLCLYLLPVLVKANSWLNYVTNLTYKDKGNVKITLSKSVLWQMLSNQNRLTSLITD